MGPERENQGPQIHSYMVQGEQFYNELIQTASKHFSEHSLFEPLPYNPDKYPFQRLDICHVPGEPASNDVISLYAEQVLPGALESFNKELANHPQLLNTLHRIRTQEGSNIIIVTNHGELPDIAAVTGLMRIAYDQNYPDQYIAQRTGLVISKGIGTFNVPLLGKPALEIITEIGTAFMSIPRTETFEKMDNNIRSTYNRSMLSSMAEWLDCYMDGGALLGIAPSGSKDENGILKPVNHQTAKILSRDNCYVLPISVSLAADTPGFLIHEPRKLQSAEDAHAVMHLLAEGVTRLSGKETFYAENSAELQRIRGLKLAAGLKNIRNDLQT